MKNRIRFHVNRSLRLEQQGNPNNSPNANIERWKIDLHSMSTFFPVRPVHSKQFTFQIEHNWTSVPWNNVDSWISTPTKPIDPEDRVLVTHEWAMRWGNKITLYIRLLSWEFADWFTAYCGGCIYENFPSYRRDFLLSVLCKTWSVLIDLIGTEIVII